MLKSLIKKFDKDKFILVGKLIFIFAALVIIINSGSYTMSM